MDTWQEIAEERSALADDLATIADSHWDTQSLCGEWKVRHVVGHLVAGADLRTGAFLAGIVKNGMNFNRYMAHGGLSVGALPPDELLDKFRKTIGLQHAPTGARPEVMLLDVVCHGVDIRRPVGMTRSVPDAALRKSADVVKVVGFPFNAKKRIAGLRVSATDAEWSTGAGPSIEGPLAALILVMAGRKTLLEEISGEGLQTLQARMP